MSLRPLALIGGAGIGSQFTNALVEKLYNNGYAVVGMGRNQNAMAELNERWSQSKKHIRFIAVDQCDEALVKEQLATLENMGPIEVYVHNTAAIVRGPFLECSSADFETAWRASVLSALNMTRNILPKMLEHQKGTIIFTGATASVRGSAHFSPFAAAKFALRGLAQSLAREMGPKGVHVAHVIVDGLIWGDRVERIFHAKREACIEGEAMADVYLDLIRQHPSCWTHELDLRPSMENF